MLTETNILLRHNFVCIPTSNGPVSSHEELATVMMNLSYYGYSLNTIAFNSVAKLNSLDLAFWWSKIETELKKITGDDRKIGDFVVYKNFPAEVLAKSEAEYWIPQILMYWGISSEYFSEKPAPREKMSEQPTLRVLRFVDSNKTCLRSILDNHLRSPARWKDEEFQEVLFLVNLFSANLALLVFKENMVRLAKHMAENGQNITVSTATDVLRLAAGLSDGDISLREKVKFKSFNKSLRKFILGALERCENIREDMARRPEIWKRLIHLLHPGDYEKQFPVVCQVMDDLYHDRLVSYASQVESALSECAEEALDLLIQRPGEFRRRLVHMMDVFGENAVDAFTCNKVINNLTVMQAVTLRSFLATANTREHRVFPPKGNWNKLQIGNPRKIDPKLQARLSESLGNLLKAHLPTVKMLDEATKLIKLPNSGDVGPYTRGTSFPIPENVNFIRTASYWKSVNRGTVWFDNGWNFFDEAWNSLGACCWSEPYFRYLTDSGAVFSGDPINSKEMQGRAAQLIDLYPEKLVKSGVRYAVWNILCFSRIPFSDAEDVFAALQWGENAQTGKLFEPSRCQLAFPLKSKHHTKYVCLLDLKKRQMTYLDANLKSDVSSAARNASVLEKNMPAFMEYLDALPSVYDLFSGSIDDNSNMHVLYSDRGVDLPENATAYIFKPENEKNKYKSLDLNGILM